MTLYKKHLSKKKFNLTGPSCHCGVGTPIIFFSLWIQLYVKTLGFVVASRRWDVRAAIIVVVEKITLAIVPSTHEAALTVIVGVAITLSISNQLCLNEGNIH